MVMLVLSRRVGERVVMSNGVVVKVLAVRGQQVRLGFEAPEDVQIWREEVSWTDRPVGVEANDGPDCRPALSARKK